MSDANASSHSFTRRDFIKSSLVSSVATTALGVTGEAQAAASNANAEHPSSITVTRAAPSAPLQKPWKNAIAVDVPLLLQREDLQDHLATLQRAIGYRYCRTYGFFQDEMAIVGRRSDGKLAFRWAQVDKVLDALQRLHLRPFVNLSPMPVRLASGTKTVFDWKLNISPPKDYSEWSALVGAFARHCADRYGLEEIAQWYFEVWNEPNIADFWPGSREDYWRLYDISATALKAVSPRLRVGGPVTARGAWIPEFISHCFTEGVPVDFISTHIYPQDEYAEYPGLQSSPYKPGRFVPDIVRSVRKSVRESALPNLEIHWTEWDCLMPLPDGTIAWNHNPSLDNASGGATVCDLAIAVDEDCETFGWWTASDLLGEDGMPQSEFSGTYGLLTLNGLPKATFNAFCFLNRLRGGRLELQHEDLGPGRGLVATSEGVSLQILLWHRSLPRIEEQGVWEGAVVIPWSESTKPVLIQERIIAGAGSCYETWQSLGTPQNLSLAEHRLLRAHAIPEARLFRPNVQRKLVSHSFRLAPGDVVYLELRPQGVVPLPNESVRQELARCAATTSS